MTTSQLKHHHHETNIPWAAGSSCAAWRRCGCRWRRASGCWGWVPWTGACDCCTAASAHAPRAASPATSECSRSRPATQRNVPVETPLHRAAEKNVRNLNLLSLEDSEHVFPLILAHCIPELLVGIFTQAPCNATKRSRETPLHCASKKCSQP